MPGLPNRTYRSSNMDHAHASTARGQRQGSHESQPHGQPLSRPLSLQATERIATLTTVSPQGDLRSRPILLVDIDSQGRLWFICEANEWASLDGRPAQPNRVGLAFDHGSDDAYVAITGQGIAGPGLMGRDPRQMGALWRQLALETGLPAAEDARLAMLCVVPEDIECWDAPGHCVLSAHAMNHARVDAAAASARNRLLA